MCRTSIFLYGHISFFMRFSERGSYSFSPFINVCTIRSAVQQLVEGGGEGKGVLPDELVGSDTPGFGVLGIGVERDAGHIEEGGFFGYIAGVGHDTFGLVDEEAEVQVALRRQDVQAGHVKPQ